MSQEGRIVKVLILQQHEAKLSELKKGSLFKVVTSGAEGQPAVESDWQTALVDPTVNKDTGEITFKSDTVTMLMGTPKVIEISSLGDMGRLESTADISDTVEVSTGKVEGATAL